MNFKTMLSVLLFFGLSNAYAEIKNPQNIIGGLLTRAGVKQQKPLSQSELTNLCEQGYTQAYFLYKSLPITKVSCSKGTISYGSLGDFRQPGNIDKVLNNIQRGLNTKEKTFVHCNNGAHASGFIAAVALKSFCGISGDQAVKYFDTHLGGYPLLEPNYSSLMKRLRNYEPRKDLLLDEGSKANYDCSKY